MTEKEYKTLIAPHIDAIMKIAQENKIPLFFSVMLSPNGEPITEENITYKNEMFSPRMAGLHLKKNDYIADYIKITNGFIAQPASRTELL